MGIHMNGNMGDGMNGMSMSGNMGYGGSGYSRFRVEDNMCVTNNVKFDVNQYTTAPTPTTYTPSKHEYHKSTSTFLHATNSLLKTINFDLEDIKQSVILDSRVTNNFLLSDAPIDDKRPT